MHALLHRIAIMKETWKLNSILNFIKSPHVSSRLTSKPYPLCGERTLVSRGRLKGVACHCPQKGRGQVRQYTVQVPRVKRIFTDLRMFVKRSECWWSGATVRTAELDIYSFLPSNNGFWGRGRRNKGRF